MTPIDFFSEYMRIVGTPSLDFGVAANALLQGKKLGVINGSSWVSLWSNWFGHKILPGVKIVNVGNEAVQLNFMEAHRDKRPTPPEINIECFCRYAMDLYTLYDVDAIMISCSTMNRAYTKVKDTMKPYGVPVFTIDGPMMEDAVLSGSHILIVATHGPTVDSTRHLLEETAERCCKKVSFSGVTIEEAFEQLGHGNIVRHNEIIAEAIRAEQSRSKIDVVVLAQLSMAVFSLSYPDPIKDFGIPVIDSAHAGFRYAEKVLSGLSLPTI